MASPDYPLQGVRILDMATVLAGPFSATLCGDMGAEVVTLDRIGAIVAAFNAKPVVDPRLPEAMLYDEDGMPR